jgi:hypothetical protein
VLCPLKRDGPLAISGLLLLGLAAACSTVESDVKGEKPRDGETRIQEGLERHEPLTLTIRTPDGRSFRVHVSPSEFQKAGFLAVRGEVCTPPHEKISDKCVKCANENVACRD